MTPWAVRLGLIACAAASCATPIGAATAASGSFERAECPFVVPAGPLGERIECGWLSVPERHERPAGARIRLPVAIIRSAGPARHGDPIVFLAGGPGAAPLGTVNTAERFAQHPFARDHDIILYNQRGSPQTEPALTCRSLEPTRTSIHAADLSIKERDARLAAASIACLDELRDAGRDLDTYGAEANAHDLKAMRLALGVRKWNLLAVSYGTWMALEAVRVDPEGVRSLVLDSIMSASSDLFMSEASRNFSIGLDRLIASCTADSACKEAFPDLASRLRHLISALDEHPAVLRLPAAGVTEPVEVVVNWHDFLSIVHWMLYNSTSLRLVPLLISEVERGDVRLLARVMEYVYPGLRNGAPGPSAAFFATVCRDQFTRRNPLPAVPGNPDYRGFSIVSFMSEVCASKADIAASRSPPAPVASAVPTLLLSGRFDPMTPDVYAYEVAATLKRAARVTIGDSGHSTLSDFESCQTRVAERFLSDLQTKLDDPCLADVRRPRFVTIHEDAVALLPGG